jgi:mono/diheme cytochrome c family protein
MRRAVISTLVSIFAVALLAAGLASSFLGDSGGYKISPEMKQPEARAETAPAAAASTTGARAMAPAVTPARFRLRPDDAALVAEGKVHYAAQCASCHGIDLKGQPNWKQRGADGKMPAPPHDASGHTWHHPDGMLFAVTKFGPTRISGQPSAMPGYEGILSDEQIIATLSYIKSVWPQEIRQRHDAMNAQRRAKQTN